MNGTPKTSMLTTLWCAETLTGERTQVAFVQSIPPLKTVKESINYNALDFKSERQAKGTSKAENIEIPILYTEQQHDSLKVKADSDKDFYWFIQLPEETAVEEGKPLTWYFQASCDLANENIEIDGMLQEKITLYRSTEVEESKGFPTA